MRDAYINYDTHKKQALKESEEIREIFTWDNAAQIAGNHLIKFYNSLPENKIEITFEYGPKVEVKGKAAVFPQKAKERITYSKKDKKEIKNLLETVPDMNNIFEKVSTADVKKILNEYMSVDQEFTIPFEDTVEFANLDMEVVAGQEPDEVATKTECLAQPSAENFHGRRRQRGNYLGLVGGFDQATRRMSKAQGQGSGNSQ
jgi:hypothetical protein